MEFLLPVLTAAGGTGTSDGSAGILLVIAVVFFVGLFIGWSSGKSDRSDNAPCDDCKNAQRVYGVFYLRRGESNKRMARYCPSCGRPLAEDDPDGELIDTK